MFHYFHCVVSIVLLVHLAPFVFCEECEISRCLKKGFNNLNPCRGNETFIPCSEGSVRSCCFESNKNRKNHISTSMSSSFGHTCIQTKCLGQDINFECPGTDRNFPCNGGHFRFCCLPEDVGEEDTREYYSAYIMKQFTHWSGLVKITVQKERVRIIGDRTAGDEPLKEDQSPDNYCAVDSTCSKGKICDRNQCISGCRVDTNCRPDEACVNRVCQNPCSGFRTCGSNALCFPVDHDVVCTCPPDFTGDPNKLCVATKSPPECVADKQCPRGQICSRDSCVDGCRASAECPSDKNCVNNKCINACAGRRVCGHRATCSAADHVAVCKCPRGFKGDPYVECKEILDECFTDNDCRSEHICLNQQCDVGCRTSGLSVYTGDRTWFCVCPLGYELQPTGECRAVKLCIENNPCAAGAFCRDKPGSYECICPIDTRGDPYRKGCKPIIECTADEDCTKDRKCDANRKCESPCHECVPNDVCKVEDHKATCIVGCRTHRDCPNDKACVNGLCQNPCTGDMCVINSNCSVENHESRCTCSLGYTGDALRKCFKLCDTDNDCGSGYACVNHQCSDINECTKKALSCGPGATCHNLAGWYKCSCPSPLIGNAYGSYGCKALNST